MDPSRFAALNPNTVSDIRLGLHPSAEIVRSPHPIVTIWAMNSGGQQLAAIEDWRGEDALVTRPRLDVEVRLLPSGGATFLHALGSGHPISAAAEVAFADHAEFDLSRGLAELISSGVVIEIMAP